MFGGKVDPPKYVEHRRRKPMTHDIQLPWVAPGFYAHVGRQPNTDYHVRLLHYNQRREEEHLKFVASEAKRLAGDIITAKYDKHAEKKIFQRQIQERFEKKLKNFDQTIVQRRERLRKLLCEEEQQFYLETIDKAQRGHESKLQEMKMKAEMLKAQSEAERLEVVKEKRLQQYREACVELRPIIASRNLVDTKRVQLIQMKENELRREAEKELDDFWHQMLVKEIESKNERDYQIVLEQSKNQNEMMDVWKLQVDGKKFLKGECARLAAEESVEMEKLREEMRREEIDALNEKCKKREAIAKDLEEQLEIQEKFLEQRRREEEALEEAFTRLAADELERERQKIQDLTTIAKREQVIYRQHLRELKNERKNEEAELDKLLQEHKEEIQKKQDDAKCKIKEAKDKLHRECVEGRAEQLKYKLQEAENLLRQKEAESELLRLACETNARLEAEHERLQTEAVKQYRQDLKQQIEFNKERELREREQLERELAESRAEEEKYRVLVEKLMKENKMEKLKHPFKLVVEENQKKCKCPM